MSTTHKKTFQTLSFILVFLVALIAAIFFTQYNSQKNIKGLIETNRSAAVTFDINNRLQEIINYTEVIEQSSRDLYKTGKEQYAKGAADTIKLIENHLSVLNNISSKNNTDNDLTVLTGLVQDKIKHIKNFLAQYKSNGNSAGFLLTDSLVGKHLDENIYMNALNVQRSLENNLKKTLSRSSRLSEEILRLDKILSVVAILAIVILGTFIIKRLLEQVKLISKLASEKERADKSAGIKEQFLANMSHEIRTPINAVVGFSNLLQKTPLQSDQKQFVDLIQSSGENLLSVVNDILDISKLDAGMMRITKNPFSIRDTCMSREMIFYHKAMEKNISFSCMIDQNIPDTLIGDVERLNQVMTNLINNAIKFTPEGGEVNFKVTMENKTTDKVDLLFSVKDSGIGIPANKLAAIFERFEQADSDTSRQYGGTGLGLSIVKKIINLQDGDIRVLSEPGKGSEFIFTIGYNYMETPVSNAAVQNPDKVAFTNIKALVAEDNLTNQTLLKFTLQQWNLEYDLAESGKQALELIKKNKYDIVLMDIQMPVMDGYEAAKRIRKEINTVIPIIAMTAHVMPTEREKCIKSGMNDYISKPLKEAEFLQLLKKYLPYTTSAGKTNAVRKSVKNDFRYIDIDYLNNVFPDNNEFIKEIMYRFSEQYPKELKQLKYYADNMNPEGVKSLSHHLKTTVSALSIDTALRIHLEKIEDFVKDSDWAKIQEEVNTLVQKEKAVMLEVNTVITAA
jgi:signal transduction histidine kinase/DNA-binding response OmpR family regulator